MDITSSVHSIMECSYFSHRLDLGFKLRDLPILPVLTAIHLSAYNPMIGALKLNNNHLFGVIEADKLLPIPFRLNTLDLSHNDLYGFVRSLIQSVPRGLKHLYLQNNHLCDDSHFPWELLPNGLENLSLQRNDFRGRIEWNELPSKLTVFTVSHRMAKKSKKDMPNEWSYGHQNEGVEFVKTH